MLENRLFLSQFRSMLGDTIDSVILFVLVGDDADAEASDIRHAVEAGFVFCDDGSPPVL